MVTCIKNWIQKSFWLIIALFLVYVANGQPIFLDPELTANNGLHSNAIQVIQKDKENRVWLGTDLGLHIPSDKSGLFKQITDRIGNQPVWAIAFYRDYAFVGTRFDGVYICDLTKRSVIQHFDSSKIGLCRRFRVIHDTVFLATKELPVYFIHEKNNWQVKKLRIPDPSGRVTDFALWQNRIFASLLCYWPTPSQLHQLEGDTLVPFRDNRYTNDLKLLRRGLGLCLISDSINLYEGGHGYLHFIDSQRRTSVQILEEPETKHMYPVWDLAHAEKKLFAAVGDPFSEQAGMIVVSPEVELKGVRPNFFGLSLNYDPTNQTLWMGTLNRGVFAWRFIANIHSIQGINPGEDFTITPFSADSVLLFNKDLVIVKDLNTGVERTVYQRKGQRTKYSEVADVKYFLGKVAILLFEEVLLYQIRDRSIELLNRKKITSAVNRLLFRNNEIFVFAMFHDYIEKIVFDAASYSRINAPSIQVRLFAKDDKTTLYYSDYSGFYVFDTTSHLLNISIPEVESFTLTGDTLWVLNAGNLKVYKIDFAHYKGTFLFENNLKETMADFMPLWVSSLGGSVYCGNHKAFLKLDERTGGPVSYIYVGNYSQGRAPESNSNFLYFNHGNYITKIGKETIDSFSGARPISTEISPSSTIYEQALFTLNFKSNDYFALFHSLKRVEFWKSNRLVMVHHTTADKADFTTGLKRGRYIVKIYSNNQLVEELRLRIKIPLTSNPVFYIIVSLFVIFFFFIIFKYLLNKRGYERKMLENRLQLLKQNLNPHFIFNSLNLIYSLVLQKKNDAAIRTINNFSDLHRYYLDNINKQKIALKDELLFIESYLKMESERVEIDDPFIYDLPESIGTIIAEKEVPPMILQPLAENAVKYSSGDGGVRTIWIDFQSKDDKIIVGIENTVGAVKTKPSGKGLGLKLVQERIDIYNKTHNDRVEFKSDITCRYTDSGYRVELLFPV